MTPAALVGARTAAVDPTRRQVTVYCEIENSFVAIDVSAGSPTTVSLRDAPAAANVAVVVSLGAPRAVRFGPNAFLYVDPSRSGVFFGQADTRGGWSTALQVPNDGRLLELPVVFQALLTGTPSPRGFELTNAVSTRLGS